MVLAFALAACEEEPSSGGEPQTGQTQSEAAPADEGSMSDSPTSRGAMGEGSLSTAPAAGGMSAGDQPEGDDMMPAGDDPAGDQTQ